MYLDPAGRLTFGSVLAAPWLFDVYLRQDSAALFRTRLAAVRDAVDGLRPFARHGSDCLAIHQLTPREAAQAQSGTLDISACDCGYRAATERLDATLDGTDPVARDLLVALRDAAAALDEEIVSHGEHETCTSADCALLAARGVIERHARAGPLDAAPDAVEPR